jgi:hypothetical protein
MSEDAEREGRTGSRWQWVAGAFAVMLALTIVAGLLLIRQRGAAQPAATGHPAGTLSMIVQLSFHCTLPVQGYTTQARISMPDGGVTIDHVLQSPKATATFGGAYVGGRWLPVPLSWVSADSKSYAYITSTTGVPGQPQTAALYVHDIAKGADRQLWSGTGSTQMIGWGPGGVFFVRQAVAMTSPGPPSIELWVVDPANPGAAHRVGPNPPQLSSNPTEALVPLFQPGTHIAGGAAWTVSYANPKVQGAGGSFTAPAAKVVRMDLKDGSLTTWFTAPDSTSVGVVATDLQGHPVLVVNAIPKVAPQPTSAGATVTASQAQVDLRPPRVLLLTGPNQTVEIANGSDPSFRPSSAVGDSHGIWFSSPGSLWLYRQGSLTRVADVPGSLFPLPTPPPNAPTLPPNATKPSPPPGTPTGVVLALAGRCS